MKSSDEGRESSLVSRLRGFLRRHRSGEEGHAPPVRAGRVHVLYGSSEVADSPFDTTLDECTTVITSAVRV